MAKGNGSKKTRVLEILFERFWPIGAPAPLFAPMLVTNADVQAAITQRNAEAKAARMGTLSASNPANFLKDLIRKDSCNTHWPKRLKQLRVTARQRYGDKQVLEFVFYRKQDRVPFPDRFLPGSDLSVFQIESLSIPRQARALGREDEPWLIQVIVTQRVTQLHFAASSPLDVTDLTHLQMSVKTQPEIDAVYVASISTTGGDVRAMVTCEAKQYKERLLEDQIREQVSIAFETTKNLAGPDAIQAIVPLALQVVDSPFNHGAPRLLYLMQFKPVSRKLNDKKFQGKRLYNMPLVLQSSAYYSFVPTVKGISF